MSRTYDDAVRIARGCHDYGGGYGPGVQYEAFQHGIGTVVASLESADKHQVAALHAMGASEVDTLRAENAALRARLARIEAAVTP